MRQNIHPNYVDSTVKCACGNSFMTRSIKGDFNIDICNACHPFFTGTQKFVDTEGRIDRFKRKYAKRQQGA